MRHHLVLPVLLASAIGLAACGGQPDVTAPATTEDAGVASDDTTSGPAEEPSAGSASGASDASTDDPTAAPAATGTAAAGDCSAAGMSDAGASFGDLPEPARATAAFVLDAALRCDEQLLATAASESDTELSFGGVAPEEFFGLPEDDERVYAVIATLLTEVPYAALADDATPATFVWPRVHTGDWAESDQAWQEVVDAGLLTEAEAQDQRAAGTGYLGWRLGISGDGTWMFLVAGD